MRAVSGPVNAAARDRCLAACLLAVSGYVWYETASYPVPAADAGAEGLGPAFYPRLLAGLLAGMACLVGAAGALRRPKPSPVPAPPIAAAERLRAASLFAMLVAYWLLLPLLGYLLCTFALLVAAMLTLAPPGRRRRPATWALIGGCSAAATGGIFLLFARVVKVPIPMGSLFGG